LPPFACSPSPGVASMLRQRSLCIFMQPSCNKRGFCSRVSNKIKRFKGEGAELKHELQNGMKTGM